jgi:pimeloyl-ACP methyl ester carboxylesterase
MTGTPRPTLILLHGATCNGRMWDAVRRGLDLKFRVLTPDLPGHGVRRTETFTLQGAIDTVVAAVNSLDGGAPVILVGDSLGGYTALASADSIPAAQLKGLVLGGSSSNLTGLALLPYLLRSALFRVLLTLRDEQKLIQATAPKLVSQVGMRQEDVDSMISAGMSLRVFAQAVNALRDVDFRGKLAEVQAPVLFLNGEKDSGHMRQEASFLAVARDASVHHFPNCEHGVTIRRPAECATLVNQFAAKAFAN